MKKILTVLLLSGLAAASVAQVPVLNSDSAAKATIYIDFDGQLVQGTGWNFFGPIDAQASGLTAAGIKEVFLRVAEDYRIFNVNVTTDSAVYAAAPGKQRIRIIVTTTNYWYPNAGGTSFVNSFSWGDGTPGWVFSGALGLDVKNIAEAVAHEAGHTLGLHHQSSYNASCTKLEEYSAGKGIGEIGWAPIMGVGYTRNMTTWHTGANAQGCNVIQQDINIIASALNGFGLRLDDHGNTHDDATPIAVSAIDFQASGMINNYDDRDVFTFKLNTPTNVRINAIPQNVGTGNNGANVDIKVGLLSSFSDTIGKYNPSELLNAGVDTNLNAGTYYIVVDGVANQNLSDYGSVGSYSLAGFIASILPVHHFSLKAVPQDKTHQLRWSFRADEPIKRVHVEISKDGRRFSTLAELSADAGQYQWQPLDNSVNFYRVRAITVADERSYYSNVESLKTIKGNAIDLASTIVNSNLQVFSKGSYPYQVVDAVGRTIRKGVLKAGNNEIDVNNAQKGLLLLRVNESNQPTTYKIIKP